MTRIPLVALSVFASLIASQAVITGAYSLSQQAILLGLLPRMDVRRTSETQSGQIYLPQVNTFLMVGVLVLVAVFQSAERLTDAYGLAVTGTMLVTTILAYIVARHMWKWRLGPLLLLIVPFVIIDSVFLVANGMKIASGGWLPLLIGSSLFLIMSTWVRGSHILSDKTRREAVPLADLTDILKARAPHRVPGTAIFLTSDPDMAPVALMHNLKHNKVLHEKNIVLTVRTAETPRVSEKHRLEIVSVDDVFKKLTLNYGFMESPNVPKALQQCKKYGIKFDIMSTSFFLGRRSVVASANSGMPLWQDKIYIFLLKNSANPTDFFHIPPGQGVPQGAGAGRAGQGLAVPPYAAPASFSAALAMVSLAKVQPSAASSMSAISLQARSTAARRGSAQASTALSAALAVSACAAPASLTMARVRVACSPIISRISPRRACRS